MLLEAGRGSALVQVSRGSGLVELGGDSGLVKVGGGLAEGDGGLVEVDGGSDSAEVTEPLGSSSRRSSTSSSLRLTLWAPGKNMSLAAVQRQVRKA